MYNQEQKQGLLNEIIKKHTKILETKVPIRKGCGNTMCFCTGACQEIVGWRDKTPEEIRVEKGHLNEFL